MKAFAIFLIVLVLAAVIGVGWLYLNARMDIRFDSCVANDGITQLENRAVLRLDPFRQMGSPANIAKLFGGNQQYFDAVKELETMIYSDIA